MIVGELCDTPSHWKNVKTLSKWLEEEGVPGIQGIDTRELTKKIRERGTILGRIVYTLPEDESNVKMTDPNTRNLVEEVSVKVHI